MRGLLTFEIHKIIIENQPYLRNGKTYEFQTWNTDGVSDNKDWTSKDKDQAYKDQDKDKN